MEDALDYQGGVSSTSVPRSIFDLVLEGDASAVEQRLKAPGGLALLEEKNEDSCLPIHYACWIGSLPLVRLLVESSPNSQLETKSLIQCTPLHVSS